MARAGPEAKLLYGRYLDNEEIAGLRGPAYTVLFPERALGARRYFFTYSRSGATHSRLARRSRTTSKV